MRLGKHIKIRKIPLLCVAVIFVWVLLIYEKNQYNSVSNEELVSIREKLKALSSQERRDLTEFFDKALLFEQYPYTLVGYKPMSIFNFPVTSDIGADSQTIGNHTWHQTMQRGYSVWKKYQSLFPQKKNIIVEYRRSKRPGRKEMSLICLKLCKANVKAHLSDFSEVLGRSCNSKEILEILMNPKHVDFHTIMEHERLLGILLGFGKNNAYLYEQRVKSRSLLGLTYQQSWEKYPLASFTNEWPAWPRKWRLPGFACDPDTEETKQLKQHYQKARRIIRWTYFNRDRLEVTLALLSQS